MLLTRPFSSKHQKQKWCLPSRLSKAIAAADAKVQEQVSAAKAAHQAKEQAEAEDAALLRLGAFVEGLACGLVEVPGRQGESLGGRSTRI